MRIGMTCYPSVGGSGILASALGEDLACRGHELHFISYGRPVRLPVAPNIHFHPVTITDYGLFRYPDYTLPLSVKMAEVSREHRLDVMHVHYAVPHATAAILARSMLLPELQPRIVTTLHGTDTTLLGQDPGYGPAIRYALDCSDAVTTVSEWLRQETCRLLGQREIDVIYNFFAPHPPARIREAVRHELGVTDQALILHCSNLRGPKRIDLLLETAARIRVPFKLVVLAGDSFAPFQAEAERLGIDVVALENVTSVEDYHNAADLGLYTSESESFCLSILEGMCFGCPSAAFAVGGIPEVVEDGVSGRLVPFGDTAALASAAERLLGERSMGPAGQLRARMHFSREVIVPQYEKLYQRLCG
jgi:N-acetyl-alpha-D-glucosaminyl L-malate synthase BshA